MVAIYELFKDDTGEVFDFAGGDEGDAVGEEAEFLRGRAAEFVAFCQPAVGTNDFVARNFIWFGVLLQNPADIPRTGYFTTFRHRSVGRHFAFWDCF